MRHNWVKKGIAISERVVVQMFLPGRYGFQEGLANWDSDESEIASHPFMRFPKQAGEEVQFVAHPPVILSGYKKPNQVNFLVASHTTR